MCCARASKSMCMCYVCQTQINYLDEFMYMLYLLPCRLSSFNKLIIISRSNQMQSVRVARPAVVVETFVPFQDLAAMYKSVFIRQI